MHLSSNARPQRVQNDAERSIFRLCMNFKQIHLEVDQTHKSIDVSANSKRRLDTSKPEDIQWPHKVFGHVSRS